MDKNRISNIRRWTSEQMAAKLGVDPATLMGWEAGRHQPTGKSLALIGRLLQIQELM
jgi:DNA-binding transcriptional regulator YiaG